MKLAWNSTILIVGPSNVGKSQLATRMVFERNQIFEKESKVCLWYYEVRESIPKKLENVHDVIFKQGLPEMEDLKKYAHLKPLVIIDDQMTRMSKNEDMERVVSVMTHHYDMTAVFLIHSIFYSKTIRQLRLNCNYIILFRNNGDKLSVRCLGSQIMPNQGKSFMRIYEEVTREPYSYLVIDLSKLCPDNLRLRDNLFSDGITHAYVPS